MHLMSVAGIPFYHAVDLISRNCLAGCSGLTAALGELRTFWPPPDCILNWRTAG